MVRNSDEETGFLDRMRQIREDEEKERQRIAKLCEEEVRTNNLAQCRAEMMDSANRAAGQIKKVVMRKGVMLTVRGSMEGAAPKRYRAAPHSNKEE